MVLIYQLNSTDINCIKALTRTEIASHVVLAHYLNSKNFNCIQAVKLMAIGSHVVLVHQLNSKTNRNRITCRACLLPELKIL